MRKLYLKEMWKEMVQPRFAGWFLVTMAVLGLSTFWLGFGEISYLYLAMLLVGVVILSQNYTPWLRSETRQALHLHPAKAPKANKIHATITASSRVMSPYLYIAGTVFALVLGVLASILAFSNPGDYLFALVVIAFLLLYAGYRTRRPTIATLGAGVALTVLQQASTLQVSGGTVDGLVTSLSVFVITALFLIARQKQAVESRGVTRLALVLLVLTYIQSWLTGSLAFTTAVLVGGFSFVFATALVALYAWFLHKRVGYARDLGIVSAITLLASLLLLGEILFVAVIAIVLSTGLVLAGFGIPSRSARHLAVPALLFTSFYYLWLIDSLPISAEVYPYLQPVAFLGDALFVVLGGAWWLARSVAGDKPAQVFSASLLAAATAVGISRWSYTLSGVSQISLFVFAAALTSLLGYWLREKLLSYVAITSTAVAVLSAFVSLRYVDTVGKMQLFFLLVSGILITLICLSIISSKRRYAH